MADTTSDCLATERTSGLSTIAASDEPYQSSRAAKPPIQLAARRSRTVARSVSTALAAAIALGASLGVAHAQPKPDDKVDAKALMQSGVKLFEAGDYLGALAVFKDAYTRFPSTKILLNIGTTLKLLDRKAEAANTYQRYLDASDADPAKKPEVEAALDELDKAVARLALDVTPADAEVKIGSGDWFPAAQAKLVRLEAGTIRVATRRAGYVSDTKNITVSTGNTATFQIALAEEPKAPVVVAQPPDIGVHETAPSPVSRFGGFATALLDIPRGAAGEVGASVDATDGLTLRAAGILGPTFGAYAGATFTFLHGAVRPDVSAGVPVFFSNGARWVVRGAGGVEIPTSRHTSILVELGYEHYLNPEMGKKADLFVPAIGLAGRL